MKQFRLEMDDGRCGEIIRFYLNPKKEKIKKEKIVKGLKDLRRIYSGPKAHPRVEDSGAV